MTTNRVLRRTEWGWSLHDRKSGVQLAMGCGHSTLGLLIGRDLCVGEARSIRKHGVCMVAVTL